MKPAKSTWKPLLLGAVLALVLVGVAGATPTGSPSSLSGQRKLVIGAADFYPTTNTQQYFTNGLVLYTTANAVSEYFLAPVDFPAHGRVQVDKVEFYAYDNNSSANMAIALVRAKPSIGTNNSMALIDTGISFADPTYPRTWQTTAISPKVVYSANDTFLSLLITDDTNLRLYGATIYYRVGK
jgi:hypothetical protein